MELTVNDLVCSPVVREAKLVAGKSGRNRMVKQLSMLDGFSGYAYLKEDTFAISSGYFLSLEQKQIVFLLKELSKRGVVGLTLKDKYFSQKNLAEIYQIADELEFPIVMLAEPTKFSEIFDFFYSHIHCYRINEYLLREQVTSFLIGAIYRDGLDGFARQLYTWTGKTVLILLRQSVYSYPRDPVSPMLHVLTSHNASTQFIGLTKNKDMFWFQAEKALGLGIIFRYKKSQDAMIWIEQYGTPFNTNDIMLLEAAKTACETGVMQIAAFEQDDLQLKERFIAGLLNRTITTMSQAVSMAQRISWFIPEQLRVAVMENITHPNACQQAKMLLEEHFRAAGERLIVSAYQQRLVILLPEQLPNYNQLMDSALDILLENNVPGRFQIGLGAVVAFHETFLSYRQAELCLRMAQVLPQDKPILYEDIGIFSLQGLDGPCSEVQTMCERYIKPLIAYEKQSNVDLRYTLKVFFRNKQNYTKTGEALIIHANTVRYRIEQVEHLCNMHFSNYWDVLNLQVALAFTPFVFPNEYPMEKIPGEDA